MDIYFNHMKNEKRKLIKFSNYSLCVTLPKWVIKELKWGKGDLVDMKVDEKAGTILISKGKQSKNKKGEEKKEEYSRW